MEQSIADVETDRLVRRYAQLKGLSYTGAIRLAVDNALKQEAPAETNDVVARMRRLQELVAVGPILDPRSADDIIGYDEHGLPA